MFEVGTKHVPDILCMWEIKGSVHLVQDIYRGGFEEQQRQNEGERHQGTLSTRQLRQTLFPHISKRYFHLQATSYLIIFR